MEGRLVPKTLDPESTSARLRSQITLRGLRVPEHGNVLIPWTDVGIARPGNGMAAVLHPCDSSWKPLVHQGRPLRITIWGRDRRYARIAADLMWRATRRAIAQRRLIVDADMSPFIQVVRAQVCEIAIGTIVVAGMTAICFAVFGPDPRVILLIATTGVMGVLTAFQFARLRRIPVRVRCTTLEMQFQSRAGHWMNIRWDESRPVRQVLLPMVSPAIRLLACSNPRVRQQPQPLAPTLLRMIFFYWCVFIAVPAAVLYLLNPGSFPPGFLKIAFGNGVLLALMMVIVVAIGMRRLRREDAKSRSRFSWF
jgi:hypothetical protein